MPEAPAAGTTATAVGELQAGDRVTWLTADRESETSKIAGARDAAGFPGYVEITEERGNGWEPHGGLVSIGDAEANDAFLAVARAFPPTPETRLTDLGVTRSWQLLLRGLRSCQVCREAWSAMFVIFGFVGTGVLMSISDASAGGFAWDAHLQGLVSNRGRPCLA